MQPDPRKLFALRLSTRGANIQTTGGVTHQNLPPEVHNYQACTIRVVDAKAYWDGSSSALTDGASVSIQSNIPIQGADIESVSSVCAQPYRTLCTLHADSLALDSVSKNTLSLSGSARTYYVPGGLPSQIWTKLMAVTLMADSAVAGGVHQKQELDDMGYEVHLEIQFYGPEDFPQYKSL